MKNKFQELTDKLHYMFMLYFINFIKSDAFLYKFFLFFAREYIIFCNFARNLQKHIFI